MSWGVATQNGVSVSLASIVSLSCGATEFSPASLFTSGVAGAWYDPSDVLLNWRTNLLTYSQEFDNAVWTVAGGNLLAFGSGSVANATAAPDGTTTADLIVPNTTPALHSIWQTAVTTVSGASYTASWYVKPNGYTKIAIVENQITGYETAYDATGAGSVLRQANATGTITALANGWYRITHTSVAGASFRPQLFVLPPSYTSGPVIAATWTPNGTDGVYIYGVQLELGSTATTYQAITTPEQTYLLYDPQPVLYQDSAGTTPVTAVEQPVGLMLDKSQGLVLGSELVTNGDFSGATGWTQGAGWSIGSGVATATATNGYLYQAIASVASGKYYDCTVTITSYTSGTLRFFAGASAALSTGMTTSGTYTLRVCANSASQLGVVGTAFTGVIDNISFKEVLGNHALQATAASRPVLRARYNLLTYSEQFDNAAWSKIFVTVTANQTTAPDGTTTADKILATAGYDRHATYISGTALSGTCTLSVYAKYDTHAFFQLAGSSGGFYANFNISTGVVGAGGGVRYISHAITNVGSGWYRLSVVYTNSGDALWLQPVSSASDTALPFWTAAGTESTFVWGADLRTGSSAGTYQRIAAATDYATAGFLPYLYFVTDDSFGTNSIDFTATDKMSVCAGLTKLSDAADGALVELSANTTSNAGSFYVTAPETTLRYAVLSRGSAAAATNQRADTSSTTYNAPSTVVLSGAMNISGDSNNLRLNGISIATATGDQGTGNYGNYPLFIGRRNNATVPFNGNLYQLIVCGKALSASELASTEAYVATKTGVVI